MTGSDNACTKEFFVKALKTMLPDIEDMKNVVDALEGISDEISCEEAGNICGAAIRSFPLYEASFPDYTMKEWSEENPVPFASVMEMN